ncbi:hypothetical protein Aph02nite_24810 [Actinoplanes philippinensis]|uniref:Secreted protein n=1 Tax=Actinoplanes philippinensis TaxID=35752 RepID=A0A1I2G487_9ACTN|nr:hypothetical protein [Actinoplanes philippinensis]GIE76531.1 hypothetical protein Aph02nite_24810 [Actinoplanes philippinensis]SFF11441.1 hypothetical protein SAMN05421541_106140 [Actinoplanes philippinensis]
MRRSTNLAVSAGVAVACGLAAVAATSTMGSGEPVAGAAVVAATTTSAPARTSPPVRPALCDAERPASLDPFPFNRDAAARDRLLSFIDFLGNGETFTGGAGFFGPVDAAELATLFDGKWLDPDDRQNAAPPAWEIFQFVCDHPGTYAQGYAVTPDREDYRVSLETVWAPEIDDKLRADALAFCVEADAVETSDHLECFWD